MSPIDKSPECPGLLHVTMSPKESLPIPIFHEWYNNEHGPLRLRLPQIFTSGTRYIASDKKKDAPKYLAIYEVTRMAYMAEDVYTRLRANRSAREADVIGQVDVKRTFYDLVHDGAGVEGRRMGGLTCWEGDVADGREGEFEELVKEAGPKAVVYRVSTLESDGKSKYLILQYGKPSEPAVIALPHDITTSSTSRAYIRLYTFGPAPRDLLSLSQVPPDTPSFTSADGKTSTRAPPAPRIESYATMADGLEVPYVLEGNPSLSAPVFAFCNSLLTSLHMWDSFLEILKKERPDVQILRFDTRGRHSIPQPPQPSTLDILVSDIAHLLKILHISKIECLVGVSMGGATALNFAITHPDRVSRFIACDFNAVSSPANTQAWKDRIATAEEDQGQGIKKLATATVSRWFSESSMEKASVGPGMVDMVAGNDVEGFRYGCQALWDYDLKPKMGDCDVPGLFVVGEEDGKGALVKAMDGFKHMLGNNGAELRVVKGCGHLPMYEDASSFWDVIQDFV